MRSKVKRIDNVYWTSSLRLLYSAMMTTWIVMCKLKRLIRVKDGHNTLRMVLQLLEVSWKSSTVLKLPGEGGGGGGDLNTMSSLHRDQKFIWVVDDWEKTWVIQIYIYSMKYISECDWLNTSNTLFRTLCGHDLLQYFHFLFPFCLINVIRLVR